MNQKHTFTDEMVLRCLQAGEEDSVQFLDTIPPLIQSELDGLESFLKTNAGTHWNPNSLTLERFLFRIFLEIPTQKYQGIFYDETHQKCFFTDPLQWSHGKPFSYSIIAHELDELSQGRMGSPLRPPDDFGDNFQI